MGAREGGGSVTVTGNISSLSLILDILLSVCHNIGITESWLLAHNINS